MTISNNHQVLDSIKNMQVSNNNQNVLNDINASNKKAPKKTPLAHYYTGNTWNTDLPEHDVHDVFLLLSIVGTDKRKVIANGHIVFINTVMHIQNISHDFLYEGMLIGWMSDKKAQELLQCN